MMFLKRLMVEEEGQGLVEYSLLLALIVIGVWLAVNALNIDDTIVAIWNKVSAELKATPAG